MARFNILSSILIAGAALSFASCGEIDDFLDEEPSKSTLKTIRSAEQLDAILSNYHLFCQESATTCVATDDYWVSTDVQKNKYISNGGYNSNDLEFALWNDTTNAPYNWLNVWSEEYKKIYYANLIIYNVDDTEGDEQLKADLKAEGHFLRAYSYFNIALAHTLYYDGTNGSELGAVMKTVPSFEDPAHRGTLEELWALIDSDLQEALKITAKIQNPDGPKRSWRATKPSVNAFAARYYLYRGDYQKALEHAEAVLADYDEMEDYNTAMYLDGTNTSTVASYQGENIYFNNPLYTEYFMLLGYGQITSLLNWKDLLYFRTAFIMTEWYNPSPELLAVYEADAPQGNKKNDLRYKYLMPEHYSLRFCKRSLLHPGYVQLSQAEIITGLTMGEVYLIKAECLARTGKIQEAMAALNKLRRHRILASVYEDLSASSSEQAVKMILQERRREMPFSIRWYDLKRLNNNETAYDDVTVTRSFFPYTQAGVLENDKVVEYKLEPKSRHYAIPIPEFEINLTGGKLEQNSY